MAIYDAMFVFSDDQLITGDAVSTNVLDWGEGMEDLDMHAGRPLYLNVQVADADFAGGTSLAIQICTHSAADVGSGTILMLSQTFAQAALTAGTPLISQTLPLGCDDERYFGLYYDDTGEFTAGGIDAWIGYEAIGQIQPTTQVGASNITL